MELLAGSMLFALALFFLGKGLSRNAIAGKRLERLQGKEKVKEEKNHRKLSFWGVMDAVSKIVPERTRKMLIYDIEIPEDAKNLSTNQLLGIRITAIAIVPLVTLRIAGFGVGGILLSIASGISSFFVPNIIIRKKRNEHLNRAKAALPQSVDLLYAYVLGGKNLRQAFQGMANFSPEPLGHYLKAASREIELGSSLKEAFERLEINVPIPELSTLLSSILEAENKGFSVSDTLSVLSREIRLKRRDELRSKISKAPLKLLAPLVFLILPASIILTVGPVFLVALRRGI
ncbi:MAG: type II secretion system F family protein [Actinomycetota bacterium]|nr:type II secretion system F family protein [Actinomycetota bacterium]